MNKQELIKKIERATGLKCFERGSKCFLGTKPFPEMIEIKVSHHGNDFLLKSLEPSPTLNKVFNI